MLINKEQFSVDLRVREAVDMAVSQAIDAVFYVIEGGESASASKSVFLGDVGNYCCDRSGGLCFSHTRLKNRLEILKRAFNG